MTELILGDSNQIVSAPGKYYNVELYNTKMQFSCPTWAADRLVDISIVKLYNAVTMYVSKIEGDTPPAVSGSPGTIQSVPGTLPNANVNGKIPERFLPMNSETDISAADAEGHNKTFPILGSSNGTGFVHHFVIKHFPDGHANFGDNGKIIIGFNASTQDFQYSDAACDPTAMHWLATSNINR